MEIRLQIGGFDQHARYLSAERGRRHNRLRGIDNSDKGVNGMLKTIDHLQDAVRLGNILVCLSGEEKDKFCSPFENRFGWVQELDGDPESSPRVQGQVQHSRQSNFKSLSFHVRLHKRR